MAGSFKITRVKGGYKVTSPNGHVLSKKTTKDKAQGQIKIVGGANKKNRGKK